MRRFAKLTTVLIAAAALAVVASGCAWVKPGSLSGSQPSGIGDVRVHFNLCTLDQSELPPKCGPNTGGSEAFQYLAGIAVPSGSVPPATFTATPAGGGSPIVFTRNDEVSAELTASSTAWQQVFRQIEEEEPGSEFLTVIKSFIGGPWPPAGLQGFGYLSAPVQDKANENHELSVDADISLPPGPNGAPYTGPFATAVAFGAREISDTLPASRPVRCLRFPEAETEPGEAMCTSAALEARIGTADLKVGAPAPAQAFVGGEAALSFPLQLAATTPKPPSFALSATTNAPGATVAVASGLFTPGAPHPATHLSPTGAGDVTVEVPKTTKPGTYQVNLSASTLQGATVSGIGMLTVIKPTLKFGKLKRNRAKGTATLAVRVPAAGTVTLAGKGLRKVRKRVKKAKTLKLKIAPRGRSARQLVKTGKVKARIKVTFKPSSGAPVSKKRSVVLRRR